MKSVANSLCDRVIEIVNGAVNQMPGVPPLLCFDKNILHASSIAEQGEPFVLALVRDHRIIVAQAFIRRPIVSAGSYYYDLISPFEYGVLYLAPGGAALEVETFCLLKEEFCHREGIVSEFYRHSPFSPIPPPDAAMVDEHYYLDLQVNFEQWQATWNNSTRRGVRRALDQRWRFVVSTGCDDDIERFLKLYCAVMARRRAKQFYFFSSYYLRALLGGRDSVFLCLLETEAGDLVVGSIVMRDGGDYYHLLTAAAADYLSFRPNERMLVELHDFCRSRGGKRLLLGGGDTGVKAFKARFSQCALPYYVTKRVYREEVYQQLSTELANGSGFFPAYRQGDSAYQAVFACCA